MKDKKEVKKEYKLIKGLGYFECPVIGIYNIRKAMSDRQKAMKDEYEAFDCMHNADGIVGESLSPSKL